MFLALRHPTFRRLFAAHIVALVGTGLATIAIGFLAFDLAGGEASAVLGTIMAIKMCTYLVVGPLAPVIAARVGARRLLIGTDILRCGVAAALPFIDGLAQAYALIFVLQAASALFTPTFQAAIPTVVTDRNAYTGALALSRLAYDLETLASPALAGLLLLAMPSSALFFGTAVGFAASATLILSVALPRPPAEERPPFRQQLTRGSRMMFRMPILRGILLLHLALAAVGAIIQVLTVPMVRGELGGSEPQSASVLAAFGLGCMTSAVLMPTLIARVGVRRYMVSGLTLMIVITPALWPLIALTPASWAIPAVSVLWFALGLGYSATLAPMGRVIRDHISDHDLPDVFAAQFSLAHGWWLITYPLAGWGGTIIGIGPISLVLAIIAAAALVGALRSWPSCSRGPVNNVERTEVHHG